MIRQALDVTRVSRVLDQLDLGRWLALAIVGCATVSVWALPPQTHGWQRSFLPEAPTAAELQQRAAVKAAVQLNATTVREAWLETMRGQFAETATGDIAYWLPDDVRPELANAFRRSVSSSVGAFGDRPTPVRIGYFVVDKNQGGHPTLTDFEPFGSPETYLGQINGQPYCVTGKVRHDIEVNHAQLEYAAENPNRGLRELGACGFYAKYGEPGSPMAEWLIAGGYHYTNFVFVDEFPRLGFRPARRAFGRTGNGVGLPKQACAAGSVEVCEQLFLEPQQYGPRDLAGRMWSRQPPVATYSDIGTPWFDIALMGWIEKEFGEEAFAEFWTSDLPVKEAFATAFAMPLDVWMRDLTVRMIGPVAAGPAPRMANTFGSLLFIVGGVLFSLYISRRGNARLA